ncbi:MAG TPA: hypothetical protein VFN21_03645 [Acidimicrobiales bacterium]|nr:hypothetical protein [Acidimicrobiales bacterium]
MGLNHPENLDDWMAWQRRRTSIVRRVRGAFAGDPPPPVLTAPTGDIDVLVSIQSTNASNLAALVDPIRAAGALRVGVLADHGVEDLLGDDVASGPVASVEAVAASHGAVPVVVVPSGVARAHRWAIEAARQSGGSTFVVQHGLLTPFTPPLPTECTLLAWSEADGEFWRAGRRDVEVQVVGSQLLWNAARRKSPATDTSARPTFLGQLHAAEISRRELARVSFGFCRDHDAVYRPHPSEVDKVSRVQHALWQRRGIEFDTSGVRLEDLATPVAAIFSTGILEAAANGRPAWAYHPDPPAWVAEMWDRYGLQRWGQEPTAPPSLPAVEPAVRIAEILAAAVSSQET